MALSQRTRFNVLRRDGFTCQYCGRKPPDVVLHVDHIRPRSAGGNDDPGNLITACSGCNLGKGVTRLVEVTSCVYCGGDNPAHVFDLPHVELGRAAGATHSRWVCNECVRRIVWIAEYLLNPDTLTCAGCGELFRLLEPASFELDDVVFGGVAWICPTCTDRAPLDNLPYNGPAVERKPL